jgi:DNA-binding MarR family transcriptional regulator
MHNKHINFDSLSMHNTPEESPGYLLWRVSIAWRSRIENVLKPLNLTHPQFVVLAALAWLTRKGTFVSQVDISRISGLDPNTTSQVLRSLEAKKYITRMRSVDERSKNPMLTDHGSEVLSKALPAVEQADTEFFALLTSDKTDILKNIFRTLLISK